MGGFAWVTLATNDSYSLGALVLAHSLKRVNTAHQLAILITPGVTESMRAQLSAVFNVVKEVDVLDSRDTANLALLARPELGITFTKLHCWKLTQFEKCVFLDADTLVLQNSDELFNREEFSAAPDVGWPDCFNSGVFVFKPSDETFKSISDFALVHGTFDGGDQGLLNLYFSDWATKDIAKHLPFVYNVVSCVTYSYLPALKQFRDKLKIIHFIGATKPWLQPFDTETGLSRISGDSLTQSQSDFIQLWWNIFCTCVHPSLSSTMAGLAGALAAVKLGSPLSEEQHALQDHMRRQGWEEGHVDYMGRDSFDNIWRKICETLSTGPSPVAPVPAQEQSQAAKPEEPTAKTSPPKEVRVEARRTSVPQAEKPLETLILKPNTLLEPTSETADPLTPPSFLSQPQFPPTSPPLGATQTADTKPADLAVCTIPAATESPACPLPPKPADAPVAATAPQPPSCPLPPKPSDAPAAAAAPEIAACPLQKPQVPAPTTPATEAPSCPLPPKSNDAPAAAVPTTPATEAPACSLPPKSNDAPAAAVPTTRVTEAPSCPLPPKTSDAPAAVSTPELAACPLQKPAAPVSSDSPVCPLVKPVEPSTPSTEQPVSPSAPSSGAIDACALPKKTVQESSAKPVEPVKDTTPDACPIKPPTDTSAVEQQSITASQLPSLPQQVTPETPPQSPEQPKTPQSQPSTPTVTTATPPLSPPPTQPTPPISITEKLGIQVDIPQTPPVEAAQPAVPSVPPPQAPSGASGEEPPIPPKRKGGKGAGSEQGKQGKGGKGGKGKK